MALGKKNLGTILYFLTNIVTVWLIATFVSQLVIYLRYNQETPAIIDRWSVLEVGEDRYQISAEYKFIIDQVEYTSSHLFTKRTHPNREAAESYIENLKKSHQTVFWYGSPRHPLTTLDCSFPLKELFKAATATFIALYFLWLSRYLKRQSLSPSIN